MRRRDLWFKAVLLESVMLLALGEGLARWTRMDEKLLGPLLYYQVMDMEIHEPLSDPSRHYGLRPGSSMENHGRRTSINALGLRGRMHAAAKPSGVFRIICLGGSNTYGSVVSDGETYPAYLEKLLDGGRGRFEVWNAGVSAQTLAQNVAWAEDLLERYHPDLIMFQVHNLGRRPFLLGSPIIGYFQQDPSLYLENLRWLPLRLPFLDLALLRVSALWRTAVLAVNRWDGVTGNNPLYDGRTLDFELLQRFWQRHGASTKVVVLDAVAPLAPEQGIPRIYLQESLPPGAGYEYRDVHPPAHVYRWYAQVIAARLRAMGALGPSPLSD